MAASWLYGTEVHTGAPVAFLALFFELGARAYLLLTGQRS